VRFVSPLFYVEFALCFHPSDFCFCCNKEISLTYKLSKLVKWTTHSITNRSKLLIMCVFICSELY